MRDFIDLEVEHKRDMLAVASKNKGIPWLFVEKDYWVCWTLRKIMQIPEVRDNIVFKGGTSLSKVYGLIDRFSEDVDIAFSRSYLGVGDDMDPECAPSRKQTDKRLEHLTQSCIEKIQSHFLPAFKGVVDEALVGTGSKYRVEVDPNDLQTVLFYYPLVEGADGAFSGYVKPIVRIELGARSDHWPSGEGQLTSYLEAEFAKELGANEVAINTLSKERTFWEKATILHAEHFRPRGTSSPTRVSRHYYDLYQMHISGVTQTALEGYDLLDRVAHHKSIFFRSSRARYEEAKVGSLRLIPASSRVNGLRDDYAAMQNMFFGQAPTFDEILDVLHDLEQGINKVEAQGMSV